MTSQMPPRAAVAGALALVVVLAGCSSHKRRADGSAPATSSNPPASAAAPPSSAPESIPPLPIPSASTPSTNGSGVLAVRIQGSGTNQWPLRGVSCTATGFTSNGAVVVVSTSTSLTIRSGTPVDGVTIDGTTKRSGNSRIFSGQAATVTVQVRTQC